MWAMCWRTVAVALAAFLATVTVVQRIAHMASALNEKKG